MASRTNAKEYEVVEVEQGGYTVYALREVGTDSLEGSRYQTKRDAQNDIAFFQRTGR